MIGLHSLRIFYQLTDENFGKEISKIISNLIFFNSNSILLTLLIDILHTTISSPIYHEIQAITILILKNFIHSCKFQKKLTIKTSILSILRESFFCFHEYGKKSSYIMSSCYSLFTTILADCSSEAESDRLLQLIGKDDLYQIQTFLIKSLVSSSFLNNLSEYLLGQNRMNIPIYGWRYGYVLTGYFDDCFQLLSQLAILSNSFLKSNEIRNFISLVSKHIRHTVSYSFYDEYS
jgi:hypothetical protein